MSTKTEPILDKWANWLLNTRYGGSREYFDFATKHLYSVRDQILTYAHVSDGDTVLDVGTGDGLLGFAALPLVGKSGKVILSDISDDSLRYCQEFINASGISSNISTLHASADDLSSIKDGSVNVILSRAVLCYINDKRKCFEEFFRVLGHGSKLSICEPINRFANVNKREGLTLYGFDMSTLPEIHKKIQTFYGGPPDLINNPMLNFDERDLFSIAIDVGFQDVSINFEGTRMRVPEKWSWDQTVGRSNNPNAPSLKQAMDTVLSDSEKAALKDYLKPLMEKESPIKYNAGVFLYAVKV